MSNYIVFKQYDTGKYMSMNTAIEIDIIDCGEKFLLQTARDEYQFNTFAEAAAFADKTFPMLK